MSIPPYPCLSSVYSIKVSKKVADLVLIRRIGRKEHNFGKQSVGKGSIANATNHFETPLDNSQTSRVAVVHQPCNVLPGHFRKLLLEQCLQAGEEYEGLWFMIVFNWDDLDITFPQLSSRRLFCTNGRLTGRKYFVHPKGKRVQQPTTAQRYQAPPQLSIDLSGLRPSCLQPWRGLRTL